MKRIKYISRFATHMSARDIERIAAQSAANNRKLGITGLLVASGGVFFQVIEGPDAAVDEIYSRILRDKRHQDVLTLRVEAGSLPRLFPDWEMRKIDLDTATELRLEPMKAIIQAIIRQSETTTLLTTALERAVWQEAITARDSSPTPAPARRPTTKKPAARKPRPAGERRTRR